MTGTETTQPFIYHRSHSLAKSDLSSQYLAGSGQKQDLKKKWLDRPEPYFRSHTAKEIGEAIITHITSQRPTDVKFKKVDHAIQIPSKARKKMAVDSSTAEDVDSDFLIQR